MIKVIDYDRFIDSLRNRSDRRGAIEYIGFTDYKALPMDPVNCFEKEQTHYTIYDALVEALQLSALELAILDCYMNGMKQAEVCAELGIRKRHDKPSQGKYSEEISFAFLMHCKSGPERIRFCQIIRIIKRRFC